MSHKYYNGNLYASIAKDVKNQKLFMDLYANIVMDVKKSTIGLLCGYCNGCKKNQQLLRDLCVDITMDVKKSITITRHMCRYYNRCKTNQQLSMKPICGYCIFEMALFKL
jgi:hypothetical protein